MPKYTVTIEFETSDKLRFPVDGRILADMEAQLESLEDDTYEDMMAKPTTVKCIKASIKEE